MACVIRKTFLIIYSFLFILSSAYFIERAQAATSNCVVTEVGNAGGGQPKLPSQCADSGIGTGPGGFVFPLKTSKSVILKGSEGMKWCQTSQSNCHHDYNAADIFAPTGTAVIAAVAGRVATAHDSGSVGKTVAIVGKDNILYYYAHMGALRVSQGQNVKAGDTLGLVGTSADAMGTPAHLHFDMLPGHTSRPSCSGASCAGLPFINVQPKLVPAFQGLPQ